jgi:hypothetical protein
MITSSLITLALFSLSFVGRYTFCNDSVASTASMDLLELWRTCSHRFDSTAWTWFLTAFCRLRELHILSPAMLRHNDKQQQQHSTWSSSLLSVEERVAFFELTRLTAAQKSYGNHPLYVSSLNQPTGSIGSGFFSSVSRFFTLGETPPSVWTTASDRFQAFASSSVSSSVSAEDEPNLAIHVYDLFFTRTRDELHVLTMVRVWDGTMSIDLDLNMYL